jgi:hypothetical protein
VQTESVLEDPGTLPLYVPAGISKLFLKTSLIAPVPVNEVGTNGVVYVKNWLGDVPPTEARIRIGIPAAQP